MKGAVVVSDLRGEDPIYACNRFTIYALFPDNKASKTNIRRAKFRLHSDHGPCGR